MTDRKPLIPASIEEAARIRAELHVDEHNNPITDNPLEKEAQKMADSPVVVLPLPEPKKPLIPPWLAHVASSLSPFVVGGAALVPPPINAAVFVFGFVLAFLGGLPLPTPGFTADKPHIPAALVPGALTLSTLIGTAAAGLPHGPLQGVLALAALGLAWAAGKLVPHPEA